jgi:hypothetical protein
VYARDFNRLATMYVPNTGDTIGSVLGGLTPCLDVRSAPPPPTPSASYDRFVDWTRRRFSARFGNATIREILNRIVSARKDATWEFDYRWKVRFETSGIAFSAFDGSTLGCVADPIARR